MPTQFSHKVSKILEISRDEATRLRCRVITPEHLLLGMISDHDNEA